MVCPLCNFDPTGECRFCRMKREFDIKRLKKLDFQSYFPAKDNYLNKNLGYSKPIQYYPNNNYLESKRDNSSCLSNKYSDINSELSNTDSYTNNKYNPIGKNE